MKQAHVRLLLLLTVLMLGMLGYFVMWRHPRYQIVQLSAAHTRTDEDRKLYMQQLVHMVQRVDSKLDKVIRKHAAQPPTPASPKVKNCEEVLKELQSADRARLSEREVFGLNSSCLTKLFGIPLAPASATGISYGEESMKPYDEPHCFRRSLQESEKRSHFNGRIAEFVKILDDFGLAFFVDSGTLIGSLRHLGFPPWDDDIDIFVELRHRDKLAKYLQKIQKINSSKTWEFSFTGQADKHMKFRVQRPYFATTEERTFRFCFDMFFYEMDKAKHLVHFKGLGGDVNSVNASIIFPTILRPFEDLWLPVPRKSLRFLQLRYGGAWGTDVKSGSVAKECVYSPWSNPKSSSFCKKKTVPCATLTPHYAFVHRVALTRRACGPTLEVLVYKGSALRAAYLPDPAL